MDTWPWSILGCLRSWLFHHQTALMFLLPHSGQSPFYPIISNKDTWLQNHDPYRNSGCQLQNDIPKLGVVRTGHQDDPAQGCLSPGKSIGEHKEPEIPIPPCPASISSCTLLLKPAFVMLSSCCNIKQNRQEKYEHCRWAAFSS